MVQRGYIHGAKAAAAYLGVTRQTLAIWQVSPRLSEDLRALLQPRVIRGRTYYAIGKLDRFMDPANNTEATINPNIRAA